MTETTTKVGMLENPTVFLRENVRDSVTSLLSLQTIDLAATLRLDSPEPAPAIVSDKSGPFRSFRMWQAASRFSIPFSFSGFFF